MKDFGGKLAVITGGGTGMGRELARQLVEQGCDVAMCDVSMENMEETQRLCNEAAPQGVRVSIHRADVASEPDMLAFAAAVAEQHGTDRINLLFNNAGIGGGGSFVRGDRAEWERTFDICWKGVYYGCRAFFPMLLNADEGHIVNTSSVNGFWATLGPDTSHTAYPAAKFAVKGFTEGLINDLKLNAPHIKCSVVMPGHIGTSIVANSAAVLGEGKEGLSDDEIAEARERIRGLNITGVDADSLTEEQILQFRDMMAAQFRDNAPTTAAEAATIILDAVKAERWRILVGNDAEVMDRLVREDPESAYTEAFMVKLREATGWQLDDVVSSSGVND